MAFDRLPLLVRFLIVGLVIGGVRAIVAGAGAYLDWLPNGLLGIVLFAISAAVGVLVVASVVSGIMTRGKARASRQGRASKSSTAEEAARRALLARLAGDLRQLTEARALHD